MAATIVAATQFACGGDASANLAAAERHVRQAAAKGAKIILIQELFETPYFCKDVDPQHMFLAQPVERNPAVQRFRALAAELNVVLPVSIFESANGAQFNSLVMVDAGGAVLGVYRKSHIPDGPGYHEKFYFNPGDTGFTVFDTRYGRVGAAVCWDQWFPECARILALKGADVIVYPTAIGSEPHDPSLNSRDHWRRTMQGHAAASLIPIIVSNRIGREQGRDAAITFYGSSFIAGITGEILTEADQVSETVLTTALDFEANRRTRLNWGVFRDRRPDLYGPLLTLDGRTPRGL